MASVRLGTYMTGSDILLNILSKCRPPELVLYQVCRMVYICVARTRSLMCPLHSTEAKLGWHRV